MLLEMRESRHISSSGTVLICWQHSWTSFLFILKEDGKGESEQSPLLWTPKELHQRATSPRHRGKEQRFYWTGCSVKYSWTETTLKDRKLKVEIQHHLSSQSCDSKNGVQQTNAGCIFFPELPKCSSQRSWLCCDLDIQNKHTGHRGHKSSCTITCPAGNLALQVKPRPELELQQQLLTPLHPGPPTALSSSSLPRQGRDSNWSWKTTGSKTPPGCKAGRRAFVLAADI